VGHEICEAQRRICYDAAGEERCGWIIKADTVNLEALIRHRDADLQLELGFQDADCRGRIQVQGEVSVCKSDRHANIAIAPLRMLLVGTFTRGIGFTHGLVTPFACRHPPLPFVQPQFTIIEALLAGFKAHLAHVEASRTLIEVPLPFPDHKNASKKRRRCSATVYSVVYSTV
jgi:hypothetical protein